jgi:IclR helix-turn-helix domain
VDGIEALAAAQNAAKNGSGPAPLEDVLPRTLAEVVETFERWLFLPDAGVVYAVLGTVAAHLLPGDPVWLLVIGPPSDGKSEVITAIGRLPFVHAAATLSEAALLSGSPKRDRGQGSTGGLLRQIGESGIIAAKDFGSILNLRPDDRASVLAALREVYDGSWTRPVGTDGGRILRWDGKCGFVGGATPSIDRHFGVMGAMGERFALFRLPAAADEHEDQKALDALKNAGHEATMRAELARAVAGLFVKDLPDTARELDDSERHRLVSLARLAVRARSAVERDRYTREMELPPTSEGPARLVKMLSRLLAGLDVIGLERDHAWRVVTKITLDSLPALRRNVLVYLSAAEGEPKTSDVAEALGLPTNTVRRGLEDLAAHKLVTRHLAEKKGQADHWSLRDWTRERLATAGVPAKSPEGNSEQPTTPINNPHRVLGGFAETLPLDGAVSALASQNGAIPEPVFEHPCKHHASGVWRLNGGPPRCALCHPPAAPDAVEWLAR